MIPVKHVINNDVYNCETYEVDGLPFRGAIITDVATGNVYEETFAKDLSAFTDEKERMKQVDRKSVV